MIRAYLIPYTVLAFLMSIFAFADRSLAVSLDFTSGPLTLGPNTISISGGGVTATATAYHVEFHDGTSTIYGPFTTGPISATGPTQVFGTQTASIHGPNPGLGLLSSQALGQTETDACCATQLSGFDNGVLTGTGPKLQFALFEFNAPVNVSQVIVDDVSNNGRSIWAAGGTAAPNLSQDLANAFAGFNVVNSADEASDGVLTHTFGTLNNIQWLAVGAPPSEVQGAVGPFTPSIGPGDNFYINGLEITPVPVPAAVWLFGSGLAAIAGLVRRRSKRAV